MEVFEWALIIFLAAALLGLVDFSKIMHSLVVFFIALLLLGTKRVPAMMWDLARSVRAFKEKLNEKKVGEIWRCTYL